MTVMTGQVSAPAVIALAMSTPRRMPSLSVFHFEVDEAEVEVVGVVEDFKGRSAAGPGMVTGPSGERAFRGIICCDLVDCRVNSEAAGTSRSVTEICVGDKDLQSINYKEPYASDTQYRQRLHPDRSGGHNYADDSDCIADENAPGPIHSGRPPMPAVG
jgi:hypothetical protein